MPLGDISSGRSLGTARGFIVVDTSQPESAVGRMRQIGREMGQSFAPAGKGVDELIARIRSTPAAAERAGSAFSRLGQRIDSSLRTAGNRIVAINTKLKGFRTELAAIGVASGVIAAIGLNTAASFEDAQIQLRGLAGGQEKAIALMESLRKQAGEAGVPFADLLAASTRLLPTLQGNTAELEKWLPLVRRVAVLNRQEGLSGAAFSINEALSSGGTDLVSLAERFNISRFELRTALEQTSGDFAAALDIVLNKMGITIQTADDLGKGFTGSLNRAKDAAIQLAGAGFTPLLQALTPILQKTADWLNKLRESNPQIVTLGAGIASVAVVGAPTLLFFGQMLETLQKIKALGIAGVLGKIGLAAGAIAVGGGAGLAIGRGIGRATGNEQIANTTMSDVLTTLRRLVFIITSTLIALNARIVSGISSAAAGFVGGVAKMLSSMANFVRGIGEFLGDILGAGFVQEANELQAFSDALKRGQQGLNEFAENVQQAQNDNIRGVGRFLGLLPSEGGAAAAGGAGGAGGTAVPQADPSVEIIKRFNDQRKELTEDYNSQIADIEQAARESRLDAIRQYQQQRRQVIAQYELQITREAEDFGRQRARQQEELNRQINDIVQDRAEQEAEWFIELSDRIADIRQESQKRIADIEEQAAQEQERREQGHRNRLFDAASRLDAQAVAREQRSFAQETSNAQVDLQRRLEQERINLDERIAQENEAHQERLQQARESDQERLDDLIENFERQKELEDEDRAIRLERAKEDHEAQLAELKRANEEQLAAIKEQKAKELQQAKDAYSEQLTELKRQKDEELAQIREANTKQETAADTHYDEMLDKQEEYQGKATEKFKKFWEEVNKVAEEAIEGVKGTGKADKGGSRIPAFQAGGAVNFTGLAQLHGSRSKPEYVLNPDTTAALRSMLGNFSQGQLLASVAGGGGSSVVFQSGALQIFAQPGQSAADIGRAVRGELESLFRSMS